MKWWRRRRLQAVPEWEQPAARPVPDFYRHVMRKLSQEGMKRRHLDQIWEMLKAYSNQGRERGEAIYKGLPDDVKMRFFWACNFFETLKSRLDIEDDLYTEPARERPLYDPREGMRDDLHALPQSETPHFDPILHAPQVDILHGVKPASRPRRPGRRPKLSPEQREQALRMRADGRSNAEIARIYGVSRSTISRLSRFRPDNLAADKPEPA